ncbi:hypothetical protein SVIOM342S_07849 [Streptomyces violaceorubidus]
MSCSSSSRRCSWGTRPRPGCSGPAPTRAGGTPWSRPGGSRTSYSTRYRPTAPGTGDRVAAADRHWLGLACELAERCPPSVAAVSVVVLVAADGQRVARGFSREGGDPVVHAEEAALAKVDPEDPRLARATVYSSLEPCACLGLRAPVPGSSSTRWVRRVVTDMT